MRQPEEFDHNPWLRRWLISFSSLIGGMVLFLAFSQHRSSPIARPKCEADGDYLFIGSGQYIKGSSQEEREYAYKISAQMLASNTTDFGDKIQQLKKGSKFNQEHYSELANLPPFCIGRHLVTNAEYQVFIQATGHKPPYLSEQDYQKQGAVKLSYEAIKPYLWQGTEYPSGRENHPVVLVSQKDAIAYAKWKSKQNTFTYRLPSADEWEKAARGRDGRYFPWGNLWQEKLTGWQPFLTMPSGQYPLPQSPFKVEDLVGTVLQLTNTVQFRGTYVAAVLKGCIWGDLPGSCRVASHQSRPVNFKQITQGFRLIRDED
jgi:formylglycine-generating enzyme required for sulfatase activity